ncbi:Protein THO1 [Pleurostoma richardsiae]|uniref:Protein THO1 n=1 Tax=Pleurostoma richardsiae TaxID=41990 RepID=A0AA38RFP4_9PEZI|nr:Protein THO1 [Pleurostoma richardsiae]
MVKDWSKLKVVDLRNELKRRGLPQNGLKQDLVDRIIAADSEDVTSGNPVEEEVATATEKGEQAEANPTVEEEASKEVENTKEEGSLAPVEEAEPTAAEAEDTQGSIGDAPAPADSDKMDTADAAEEAHSTSPDVDQDAQKRKRRSSTPAPSAKRVRQAEQPEDIVDYETSDIIGNGHENGNQDIERPKDDAHNAGSVEPPAEQKLDEQPLEREETKGEKRTTDNGEPIPVESSKMEIERPSEPYPPSPTREPASERATDYPDDDRVVEASIHPATSALYIKNFMRPLRAVEVQDYIITLATPPGSSRDSDIIEDFFLDQIRTHAFVSLRSVAAASRVRTGLHGRVWPDERNRKALMVDFIPPEKVREWADKELAAGRGASRWEVVYDENEDGVTARLTEADFDTRPPRIPTGPAPKGPAVSGPNRMYPGIEAAPSGPRASRGNFGNNTPGTSVPAQFTKASPSIRFVPVDEELARRRIDNIHSYVSKDRNRDLGAAGDINRYTFEDKDSFVDRGREVFIGIRPPHREREKRERERQGRGPGGFTPASGGRYDGDRNWRRDDYARPPPRPAMTDEDRYPRYDGDRRSFKPSGDDRRPRYNDYRSDWPRDRYGDSYRSGRY